MTPSGNGLRTRVLHWSTTSPAPSQLRRDGYHVLRYRELVASVVATRPRGGRRSSLRNPAAGLLDIYRKHARVAVLDVVCRTVEDLQLIYGYLLEPAFRSGCDLLIGAERELETLSPEEFIDPEWRCPWTLERLRYLAGLYAVPEQVMVPGPVSRWRRIANRVSRPVDSGPRLVPHLDAEQNAAIGAGDGTVQVIAPAGSGKTTVLVERVRELCRRGTRPDRILCSTFNRDACLEMGARLAKVGLGEINVRSFHGLGLSILKEEKCLRDRVGTWDVARWKDLAAQVVVAEPGCGHFDASVAQNAVGIYKLVLMISPRTAWERAVDAGPGQRAKARAYVLYQRYLRQESMLDFDDLICESITLLQDNARIREKWQARFERVLVDEYQDIEPSQALLIGLLAAPQDSLFCVGDEDQCIYAWRRASVQRVIDLDQVYPGLERYPLVRNYRCGRSITKASRRLIGHNRIRFKKPLRSGIPEPGRVKVRPQKDLKIGASFVARMLRDAEPGKVAVLARTGRLLADVEDAYEQEFGGRIEGIELATVHGAKGREWDRVILFGADQGRFPLARVIRSGAGVDDNGGLEDERRLFYVAMTRARLQLDIVCSAMAPSQFLQEAGIWSSWWGRWG